MVKCCKGEMNTIIKETEKVQTDVTRNQERETTNKH